MADKQGAVAVLAELLNRTAGTVAWLRAGDTRVVFDSRQWQSFVPFTKRPDRLWGSPNPEGLPPGVKLDTLKSGATPPTLYTYLWCAKGHFYL